jgi:hypothetical protein
MLGFEEQSRSPVGAQDSNPFNIPGEFLRACRREITLFTCIVVSRMTQSGEQCGYVLEELRHML